MICRTSAMAFQGTTKAVPTIPRVYASLGDLARADDPRYLTRVEAGEEVMICRRNVPMAELRAVVGPDPL